MTRGVDPLTVGQLLAELRGLLIDRPEAVSWPVAAGFHAATPVLLAGLREFGYGVEPGKPWLGLWLEGDGELPPLRELNEDGTVVRGEPGAV